MAYDLKFYLPSSGAPDHSFVWSYPGTWTDYASGYQYKAPDAKISSTFAYRSFSDTTATLVKMGCASWLTPSQSAHEWVLGDSFRIQVECEAGGNFTTCKLYAIIRVVSENGVTFRGTLFNGVGNTDFNQSDTVNRTIYGNIQNAVSMLATDRITIELGYQATMPNTTQRDGYLRLGCGTSTGDLPEDETELTDLNPWLGFTYGGAVVAPTVTTTTITAIAPTTATGGGNVTSDGGATVTARGVCWNTSTDPTTANSHTTDGSGTGVFASSLTSLSPNTHYFVRAYATNSVGTSYGSDVEFTTGLDVTCAIIGVSG